MNPPEVWVLVFVLAAVLNMVPGFMPPTWALLAFFRVQYGLDIVPLALVGALGATVGRALLAIMSRGLGERIVPKRWRANVNALVDTIRSNPAFSLPTLGLFALGPVPSNHLFIAAGLSDAPLAPMLSVFAGARFISYLIWVSTATFAAASLQDVVSPHLGGGLGLVVQIVGFILLILVMQVDWASRLQQWNATRAKSAGRAK